MNTPSPDDERTPGGAVLMDGNKLRDEIYAFVARLDRVASKLGEPLGPVRGDVSSDPVGQA